MNRNYPTYRQTARYNANDWADARQTHAVVAAAIHAIACAERDANEIWEAPTTAEMDNVIMCIAEWALHGDIEPEADGRYPWGTEIIQVPYGLAN
jgi:hypothetical protein